MILLFFKLFSQIASPQDRSLELKISAAAQTDKHLAHVPALTFPCSFKQKLQPCVSVCAPVWARARGLLLPPSRFVHFGNEERAGAVQDFMRVRRHLRGARLFISVGIDTRARE